MKRVEDWVRETTGAIGSNRRLATRLAIVADGNGAGYPRIGKCACGAMINRVPVGNPSLSTLRRNQPNTTGGKPNDFGAGSGSER